MQRPSRFLPSSRVSPFPPAAPGVSDPAVTLAGMTDAIVSPVSLSDAALLSATRDLVGKSRILEADLVVHLGEIEERRLYLDAAYPSMFAFCMDELGFSEDVAYNRLAVARVGRKLPAVIEELRSGRVHLAGLRLLAPHLTELNHEIILMQAANKSKRMIEELVARIAPSPPVRTGIRRVPECGVASWSPIPSHPLYPQQARMFEAGAGCGPAASTEGDTPAGVEPPMFADGAPEVSAPAPSGALFRESAAGRPIIAPMSADNFMVRFNAPRQLRDKLLEAQALLRHSVPDGDLAIIIGKGIDLLLEKVKKERFGIGRKPRPTPRPEAASPAEKQPELPASRHIPDAIKRAVYERDGGCCSFVNEQGRKCGSTDALTFDHEDGFARNPVHTVEKIRLVCRAHNQHAADKMYGRAFMERARRGNDAPTPPPPVPGREEGAGPAAVPMEGVEPAAGETEGAVPVAVPREGAEPETASKEEAGPPTGSKDGAG